MEPSERKFTIIIAVFVSLSLFVVQCEIVRIWYWGQTHTEYIDESHVRIPECEAGPKQMLTKEDLEAVMREDQCMIGRRDLSEGEAVNRAPQWGDLVSVSYVFRDASGQEDAQTFQDLWLSRDYSDFYYQAGLYDLIVGLDPGQPASFPTVLDDGSEGVTTITVLSVKELPLRKITKDDLEILAYADQMMNGGSGEAAKTMSEYRKQVWERAKARKAAALGEPILERMYRAAEVKDTVYQAYTEAPLSEEEIRERLTVFAIAKKKGLLPEDPENYEMRVSQLVLSTGYENPYGDWFNYRAFRTSVFEASELYGLK